MEILKRNTMMNTLSIILGATTVMLMPVSALGLVMGFNEDIINNTGQDAYDFHLEGTLKSATTPRQLSNYCYDAPRGSIPDFDWRYDGGSIRHVCGKLYHYSGTWSGTIPVQPGQTIHIGKYFDVTCENIFVDLRGWWTNRAGEKINPDAGKREGEIWRSDVALLGFEIVDNIPARLTDPNLTQTVMLQNSTNHTVQVESALVVVTDVYIPLDQLVRESEFLDSLEGWRDIPSGFVLFPGENWTFDLSEVDVMIQPNQNTVLRADIVDLDTGDFHFYAGKCQAHSATDPVVRVNTLDGWRSLLGRPEGQYPRIDPVTSDVFEAMVLSDPDWPSEYQEAVFATPELDAREHEDGSGQIEPALYMRWGPEDTDAMPGQFYAAAWDYDYGRDTDFRNVELEFSIRAPRESTLVSINLIDADDDWREFIWPVNRETAIPPCEWTTVRLDPLSGTSDYPLRIPFFEGGGDFDLNRVRRIRFDENVIWTEDLPFPLDRGWVWNAWANFQVQPVDPDTDGLVAYYPFENDTIDMSGNGLDGTIIGDAVFVDGVEGMALDFNGDDYVDCGGVAEFSFTDAMTVSTWINIRSVTTTWMAMIAKGENAWRLGVNGDTTGIHYAFTGGDRGWQAANTVTELNFDEWYHVAATYDTNVGALVYINGVVDASNPDLGGIVTNEMPLLLGENPEATGRFFDGILDGVKIYDRALSEDEIRNLAGS